MRVEFGRRGGNRTHNPRLRRPVLYPIELLAHALNHCSCEVTDSGGAGLDSGGAAVRIVALSDGLKVTDNHSLGPVGTIRGTAAEECAMAAVAWLNEVDMGIGKDSLTAFGKKTDERIVLGENDKRGNSNPVDHTRAGGPVVVVVCIAEAAIGSDDFWSNSRMERTGPMPSVR